MYSKGTNFNVNYQSPVTVNNLTYTPLGYANGPGGLKKIRTTNLTNEQTSIKNIFLK